MAKYTRDTYSDVNGVMDMSENDMNVMSANIPQTRLPIFETDDISYQKQNSSKRFRDKSASQRNKKSKHNNSKHHFDDDDYESGYDY